MKSQIPGRPALEVPVEAHQIPDHQFAHAVISRKAQLSDASGMRA
jgi:hypothetical protein